MLNHNDDFFVETYWSRCLDPYWWGVEFKAFGEKQILDLFVANGDTTNNVVTFGLMLLFFVNGTCGQDFQGSWDGTLMMKIS